MTRHPKGERGAALLTVLLLVAVMAVIAATVANNGTAMRPYLISDLRGPDLSVLERTTLSELGSPMSATVAKALGRSLADAARLPACRGCTVDGITVHALISRGDEGPATVIAYSGSVAVAVVVEPQGSVAEARSTAARAAMSVLGTARPAA